MIVRAIRGELWLFDQRDHSELCGRMASHWGGSRFPAVPPAVQRAAAIHDSGWPEWDHCPRLNAATGRPHPYSQMPSADYREIWRRGLERGWAEGEEVGLLVSLHAMRFFERKSEPADRRLLAEQRERQRRALRALGAARGDAGDLPEPFASWHAWMFFWDGLSLFLCEGWKSPWTSRLPTGAGDDAEVRVERGEALAGPGAETAVEPFPFREALVLEAVARIVPELEYGTQAELTAALRAAERRRASWRVRASR